MVNAYSFHLNNPVSSLAIWKNRYIPSWGINKVCEQLSALASKKGPVKVKVTIDGLYYCDERLEESTFLSQRLMRHGLLSFTVEDAKILKAQFKSILSVKPEFAIEELKYNNTASVDVSFSGDVKPFHDAVLHLSSHRSFLRCRDLSMLEKFGLAIKLSEAKHLTGYKLVGFEYDIFKGSMIDNILWAAGIITVPMMFGGNSFKSAIVFALINITCGYGFGGYVINKFIYSSIATVTYNTIALSERALKIPLRPVTFLSALYHVNKLSDRNIALKELEAVEARYPDLFKKHLR